MWEHETQMRWTGFTGRIGVAGSGDIGDDESAPATQPEGSPPDERAVVCVTTAGP